MTHVDLLAPLAAAFQHEMYRFDHGLLTLLLPVALLMAAFSIVFGPTLKGWYGEALVTRRLRSAGYPTQDDIILQAADGTLTQVDHVALTMSGILVIETKNRDGLFFGRERDRSWTQVSGRRRHTLQNPLRQNFRHVRAVEELTGQRALGLVVFTGDARFPKGTPAGVVHFADLLPTIAKFGGAGDTDAHQGWQRLLQESSSSKPRRQEHRSQLEGRFGKSNCVVWAVAFVVIAAALLAIRFAT